MNYFDTFTNKQKETHLSVQALIEEMEKVLDPTTFVLNPEASKLQKQIEELQDTCDHMWVDGVCAVCGRVKAE